MESEGEVNQGVNMAKSKRQYVVTRTFSAGVHVGELVERNGKEVQLANARRIWYWQGAASLHQVADRGVGAGSKVSVSVPSIILTEAIEIIPCSEAAEKNLREYAPWVA